MALGVERDTVGDIIESSLIISCLPELSDYISENLVKAGRARVKLSVMELDALPARTETLAIKTDTVASVRLDAVLASAFGLSRG